MTSRRRTLTRWVLTGVVAVGAASGAAWWWSSRSSEDALRVTGRRWERIIVLEKFDGTAWRPVYEVTNAGSGAGNPAWPTSVPPSDVPATPGAMRAGSRIELLSLEIGTLGTCRVAADVWRTYVEGAAVPSAVRGRDGKVMCSALQPR